MLIKIAERLRPFSHVPGACAVLPKSDVLVQVFPALIRIQGKQDIFLNVQGPVRDFTVMQDLEAGNLCVFGKTPQGYMRYFIEQGETAIALSFEKFPVPKESIFIPHKQNSLNLSKERLSLGMHKSQDWEMIRRRGDLREIFPLWIKLSGFLPVVPDILCRDGSLLLLERCKMKIEELAKTEIKEAFEQLFYAGFYSMLAPRLHDDQFQGLIPEKNSLTHEVSPLLLLHRGAHLIRSLFFQENNETISLLPCLPPEFHAGRFLNLKTSLGDEIDIEWSKKILKKVAIRSSLPRKFQFKLQKEIKSFRLRTSLQDRGQTVEANAEFTVEVPVVFCDRFRK